MIPATLETQVGGSRYEANPGKNTRQKYLKTERERDGERENKRKKEGRKEGRTENERKEGGREDCRCGLSDRAPV
jgi:hypothetical protein